MVAISGGNVGSTGKGILIGVLSAFGSAGVAIIILTLFFFLRYTQRGRIILDRIGRPGEYDDEQAFAREEADALERMDDLQQSEYLRAKGRICPDFLVAKRPLLTLECHSLCSSKPARDYADRHLAITVPSYPRKRRISVGVRA
jgi:hypothetical protein